MKRYVLRHADRKADYAVYVSPLRGTASCVASLLYWDKSGSWSRGEDILMDFKVEHFTGPSQEAALSQLRDWVSSSLGPAFDLDEWAPDTGAGPPG